MGHHAQYRHRGSNSTGFSTAAPPTTQFTLVNSAQHAQTVVTNPGLPGVVDAIAQVYLLASPGTIAEQLSCTFGAAATGLNTYGVGQGIGMRIAYRLTGSVITSPWSGEKTLVM